MAPEDETALVPVAAGGVVVAIEIARNIQKKLAAPTPREYRKARQGPAGKMLTYAPWGYTARVLNQTFGPAWSFLVLDTKVLPLPPLPARPPRGREPGRPATEREEVVVRCLLRTPFGEQEAFGSHTYFPSNGEIGYGDVMASAQSQALKRAAARLGVALDLYLNDGDDILPDADDPAVSPWRDACERYGFTDKQAIALLSEAITGDQNDLRTVADLKEALGSIEAVVAALDEAVAAMTQEPEKTAPKRGRKAAK